MILPLMFAMLAEAVPAPAAPPAQPGEARSFVSPMGEPFLPEAGAPDGLRHWFDQADANRDGALSIRELQSDCDRFFQALDIKHDGEIDPDDITHYEDEIAPQGRFMAGAGQDGHNLHRAGATHGGSHGGRRYSLLDDPEPVASADADFNRGVSRDEFEHASRQRFQLLDTNHDGKLTFAELEIIAQANANASRHPRHEQSSQPMQSDMDSAGNAGYGM